MTRDDCLNRDLDDTLAPLRAQFDLPAEVIYLDGNSLGARPKAALTRAADVIGREWGNGLVGSWNDAGWFALPRTLGDRLAPLIGARPGEVVVTDSTSINLFKALSAALHMQAQQPETASRRVIVSERSNFPTDLYMAQGLTRWLDRGYLLRLVDDVDAIDDAVDADCALVLLTHVNYRSGYQHDMAARSRHAHAQGALIVWDLAHSTGAVPLDVHAGEADLAVGCTYKYLNGGPGAPAFIWVPRRHQAAFSQPLTGWWGHAAPFAMQGQFSAAEGITRALCGTQPIVSMALVECGLDVFEQTSMAAVRAKSLQLTDLFIQLAETRCAGFELELVTPRGHARRGSHVSFTHPHGYAVMQALIRRGVIGDYREPGIMRFGFAPLYNCFAEVWDAVEILRVILAERDYDLAAERATVT